MRGFLIFGRPFQSVLSTTVVCLVEGSFSCRSWVTFESIALEALRTADRFVKRGVVWETVTSEEGRQQIEEERCLKSFRLDSSSSFR
jgi:hypothetical protein